MNPAGASSDPANPKPKPLIVVVDDELMVGDVVQAMLELGGYRTIYFQDPRKALEWLREPYTHPDLMLTDFLMPHLTGLELLQSARAARPDLKAILYSGHVEEREADNYPERPQRFLRKPFSARTLIGVVKSVLEGSPQSVPQ
jgi:DNA-binding NtrC family response regulator